MTIQDIIEVGQELVFISPSNRHIPVKVVEIPFSGFAKVAQLADLSKVKGVPISQLRTKDGASVTTQKALDEKAKWAPLNASLYHYECLECGERYSNRSTCPKCGGMDRITVTE